MQFEITLDKQVDIFLIVIIYLEWLKLLSNDSIIINFPKMFAFMTGELIYKLHMPDDASSSPPPPISFLIENHYFVIGRTHIPSFIQFPCRF